MPELAQIQSFLEKLAVLVKTHKEVSTTQPGGGSENSGRSIWSSAILIFAALIGAGVYAYVTWRQSQKIAELEHEKTVAIEAAAKTGLEAKNKEKDTDIAAADLAIKHAVDNVAALEARLKAEQEIKSRNDKAIADIKSWNDLSK